MKGALCGANPRFVRKRRCMRGIASNASENADTNAACGLMISLRYFYCADETGMRYKLTGAVVFRCDGHDVKLVIEPQGMMDLKYTLYLDDKPVKDDKPQRIVSFWRYKPRDGSEELK